MSSPPGAASIAVAASGRNQRGRDATIGRKNSISTVNQMNVCSGWPLPTSMPNARAHIASLPGSAPPVRHASSNRTALQRQNGTRHQLRNTSGQSST
jgi:hypothetical protein